MPPDVDLDNDLLLIGIELYWTKFHISRPLVHRGAFEAAFSSAPNASTCYIVPPRILLHIMAACGLSNYPDVTKYQGSNSLARAGAMALVAGYLDREPSARLVPDVEAVQALSLLHNFFAPRFSVGQKFKSLHRCMVSVTKAMCVDPADGRTVPSLSPPRNVAEWLEQEAKTRSWINALSQDTAFAMHFGWEFSGSWTRYRVILPANDLLYDTLPVEEAFTMLESRSHSFLPPSTELPGDDVQSAVGTLNTQPVLDLPAGLELDIITNGASDFPKTHIEDFVGTFASGGCSWWSLAILPSSLRLRLLQLGFEAAGAGVDPVVFLGKPPALDTPVERHYRLEYEKVRNAAFRGIRAFPDGVGPALLAGDTTCLFAGTFAAFAGYPYADFRLKSKGTTLKSTASAIIQTYVLHLLHLIIRSLDGKSPRAADHSLFSSPILLTAFEVATIVTLLLKGMAEQDRDLEYFHVPIAMPLLGAGYVLLGAARAFGDEHTMLLVTSQLETLANILERMAPRYGEAGLQLAAAFRAQIEATTQAASRNMITADGSAAAVFISTVSNGPRELFSGVHLTDESVSEVPMLRIADSEA